MNSQLWYDLLVFFFFVFRVWNEAVAHRLSTLGHSVKQGDLVWTEEKEIKDSGEATSPQVIHNSLY